MATEKQLEANRINSLKSTGPRTDAGKEAVRANALRHGMRARSFDVLPNEDPELFQARIDAWFEAYHPTSSVQDELVRHAAIITWKIDRTNRHENALVSGWMRNAVKEAEKARDERLYQAVDWLLPSAERAAKLGFEGDPAPVLLEVIRKSAEGCHWLIGRWQTLRDMVSREGYWIPEFEMHAARLWGQGPGRLREPEIVGIIVANRVAISQGHGVDPFRLMAGPPGMAFERAASQASALNQPRDPAEAKGILIAFADRAIAELEALLDERERDGDLGAEAIEAAAWMSAFDASTEGERLRRYQSSLHRDLLRTLATLEKMQARDAKEAKEAKKRANEANPPEMEPQGTEFAPPICQESLPDWLDAPPAQQESPPMQTFEEFLNPPIRANEANSDGLVQITFGNEAKRQVAPKVDFELEEVEESDWLEISCEKG